MSTSSAGFASIYVRLSHAADERNLSKQGMIDDCLRLAAKYGYTVLNTHVDDGVSGFRRDREAFHEWVRDGREGRVQALITWSLDRATRAGLSHVAVLMDVAEGVDGTTGKRIHEPVRLLDCQGLDSFQPGESWRFIMAIRAEIARAERRAMQERNLAKSRRMRSAGLWSGGRPPYGYRIVRRPDGSPTLEIEPSEAAVVRYAVDAILKRGLGPTAVAKSLTSAGFAPRRAPDWTSASVRTLLTTPTLAGFLVHRGKPVLGPDGKPLQAFPPLVSVAEHHQLVQLLAPGGRPVAPTGRRPALLRGFLRCHGCGELMVRQNQGAHRAVRWACDNHACEARATANEEPLTRLIVDEVLRVFGDFRLPYTVVTRSAAAELALLETRQAELLARLAEDATDSEALKLLAEVQAERKRLESDRTVETRVERDTIPFRKRWESAASLEERRRLLSQAIETVYVRRRERQRIPLTMKYVQIAWTEAAERELDDALRDAWERYGEPLDVVEE